MSFLSVSSLIFSLILCFRAGSAAAAAPRGDGGLQPQRGRAPRHLVLRLDKHMGREREIVCRLACTVDGTTNLRKRAFLSSSLENYSTRDVEKILK